MSEDILPALKPTPDFRKIARLIVREIDNVKWWQIEELIVEAQRNAYRLAELERGREEEAKPRNNEGDRKEKQPPSYPGHVGYGNFGCFGRGGFDPRHDFEGEVFQNANKVILHKAGEEQ